MGLKSLFGLGGEATERTKPASHVCQSCGEKYFTEPGIDINECRACGGIRVEAV